MTMEFIFKENGRLEFCGEFTLKCKYCVFIYSNKLPSESVKSQCFFITNQIKSNQIKSLLLSHHHSTSALVSEILMSVLQTVQKNNRQFTYGQTVQKKQQTIYIWTDSAKKTTDNLHMDRQCKKNCTGAFTVLQTVQKKTQQQQFTYGQTVQKNNRQFTYGQTVQKKQQTIYIWTDSAKKTALEHLQCSRQCKKKHNNRQFTYGQTVQKKQQTIYIWTDSAKKTTDNLHMDRQCKKNCTGAFTVLQTVQKKHNNSNLHMDRQCKKTTAIYIWTVHIYRLYRRQCAKYTYIYSVHIVYYKDILNYQRRAHLHYVQYLYIM